MRIHHLNCISACPLGGIWMDGRTKLSLRARLVSHCLLLETSVGLMLVDTGYGLRDVTAPRTRLNPLFLALLRPELRQDMTAFRQIAALGFEPSDVRHIVLTHLDFDHAGGLDDFPLARVHLLAQEREAAFTRVTRIDRMRYRPAQWSTEPNWVTYPNSNGEPWFGFESVRGLEGLSDEVLLVPLFGHTLGHAGVAVRHDSGWLLLAGDAYFYHGEMDVERPYCTPGLRAYQSLMQKDRVARLSNQARLRDLRREHGAEVSVLCSHDPTEFERAAGRRAESPLTDHVGARRVVSRAFT